MNHKSIKFLSLALLAMAFVFSSCEDDPKLPDNVLEFESSVAGIASEEESFTIKLTLSREASKDVIINLTVNPGTLAYGTDFTTTPAVMAGVITLTIPKGETTAQVILNKVEGVGFSGDETIVFEVITVDGAAVIGEKSKITVTFSEITVEHASMNIQGGGPTFSNRVFIDLSANRQTAVNRTGWDFGFYTVDGEFRVVLNTALSMLAKPLAKTDITTVTSADTVGLGESLTTDAFLAENLAYIDDPTGAMDGTAIATVSATASENVVYVVNRGKDLAGNQRSWKKIRVLRNGTGYTIQHADINSATFQTIEVTRNNEYLFNYVSLETNTVVQPEPQKGKWDIAYTTFMNQIGLPYMYNDFIIQNRNAVGTAQVLITESVTYENFDESDLTFVTFSTAQATIGANWRNGGGPTTAPSLRTDRFYIVKDADGNIYKLKFTALTQDGERGRPAIAYTLIRAGE